MIGTPHGESLADAGCKFCGACMEVCPTGSIRDQLKVFAKHKSRRAALVPCRETCPAGIDIPRYIRFVKRGEEGSATAVVREKVPFPGTLGHVCDHPCEFDCRRGEVNESVAIKKIKRYATEHDDGAWKQRGYQKASTGKRVAVVGAGPAGLTAAYYLAKSGHAGDGVREAGAAGRATASRHPHLPAAPGSAGRGDRLTSSRSASTSSAGAEITSAPALKDEGYDAVLVAVGTHQGVKLPLPGARICPTCCSTPSSFARRTWASRSRWASGWWCSAGAAWPSTAPGGHAAGRERGDAGLPRAARRHEGQRGGRRRGSGVRRLLLNSCTFDEISAEEGKVDRRRAAARSPPVPSTTTACPTSAWRRTPRSSSPPTRSSSPSVRRPALDADFGVELGRGNRVVVE